MIFNSVHGFLNKNNFTSVKLGNIEYLYNGFIFMPGERSGQKSIETLNNLYLCSKKIPFDKLYGAFTLIVIHPSEIIIFTDNSKLHCFYIAQNEISDSFLALVKRSKNLIFDITSVTELINFGKVYFDKTPIIDITINDSSCFYVLKLNSKFEKHEKNIGGIDSVGNFSSIKEYFQNLAYAVGDTKTTTALTGGYDSRMVFASLRNLISTVPFISGSNDQDKDIIISEKVAKASNVEWRHIFAPKIEMSDKLLKAIFKDFDGVVPCISADTYRIYHFNHINNSEGFKLVVTGDGGTFHKDWYWLTDFPFYHKKSINIDKYYRQRIQIVSHKLPLSDKLALQLDLAKDTFMKKLAAIKQRTNTESYDKFSYEINYGNVVKQIYSTYSTTFLGASLYAPLWELDLIRIAYRLPRRKRFFYNYIRDVTTEASPAIAKIPTCYGMTASSKIPYLVRDVYFQCLDYFVKFIRLTGRKILRRNFFTGNATGWSFENEIRKMEVAERSTEFAIAQDWIKPGTKVADLPIHVIGIFIQLKMISDANNLENDE